MIAAGSSRADVRKDVRTSLTVSHLVKSYAHRRAPSGERVLVPVIVQMANAETGADSLQTLGATVFYTRGDMALACMPPELVEDTGRLHFVNRLSVARKAAAVADHSRAASRVDAVHAGNGLSTSYDGSGIVAGVCDIGIDPHHIALQGRVGMMSTYVDTIGLRSVWAPGSSLHTGAQLQHDTDRDTHGTHVSNIMAGSRTDNPYYGMAPGATMALSASTLSDVGLLCGIEDICAYAREQGKPAVINLSMGSYLGPHDGTDLVNRYLDLLADDALICFSSGNNGNRAFSLVHTLGDDSPLHIDGMPVVGSLFESVKTWAGFDVLGAIDIWSRDATPVDIQLVVWDIVTRTYSYVGPWIGPGADGATEGKFVLDGRNSAVFDSLFTSDCFIRGAYGTDASNGRFTIALDYHINPYEELPGGNHWARYMAGWRVRGKDGTGLTVFTDGTSSFMRNYAAPGMVDGNADFSVSNLCANGRVMCVGSWNSRNSVPVVGSDTPHTFNYEVNTATEWSSYGRLADGTPLPHICAPGNTVVSAMSGPYLSKHPDAELAHTATVGGNTYAWYQECGTSMASPAAAGILALWLQADPSLTIERAIEVAQKTARTNFADIDNPRWGSGAIDAYAGLKYILESGSAIDVEKPQVAVRVINGCIHVACPPGVTASAYHVSGRKVPLNTPLPSGVYIVKAGQAAYKVAIR